MTESQVYHLCFDLRVTSCKAAAVLIVSCVCVCVCVLGGLTEVLCQSDPLKHGATCEMMSVTDCLQ